MNYDEIKGVGRDEEMNILCFFLLLLLCFVIMSQKEMHFNFTVRILQEVTAFLGTEHSKVSNFFSIYSIN